MRGARSILKRCHTSVFLEFTSKFPRAAQSVLRAVVVGADTQTGCLRQEGFVHTRCGPSWSDWLLPAAAAAMLLGAATCEAESPHSGSVATISEGEVKRAVEDLWLKLGEQLDRLEAQSTSAPLPRIPKPEVAYGDGKVTVIFWVPQKLNVASAGAALRRHVASRRLERGRDGSISAASSSEESTAGPEGRARRIHVSSPILGALEVDILEPYDADELAQVEFRGRPTAANLAVLESTMLAVARPRQQAGRSMDEMARIFGGEGEIGSLFPSLEEGLGPLFSPLRELLQELERAHAHDHRQWGMLDEAAPGFEPGQRIPYHRGPKRFDDDAGAGGDAGRSKPPAGPYSNPQAQTAINKLKNMGCQVFLPTKSDATNEKHGASELSVQPAPNAASEVVDWGPLAGYEAQKRAIEDCLLLPLVRPDVFDNVAKGTRRKFAPNRPRAVLFVGPPGTGKTTSARVIASQAAVPLVYIPLEALVSKWYGESEKHLAEALAAADSLPEGCIVFLDELDALATSRGSEMHEATRRLLGVLLRHMDGFDASKRSVVVGATNRPQDLDPALLSRFSATVEFGLPSESCRKAILKQYAAHLSDVEVGAIAAATPGMAGRDLRDVCEQAERRWASKIIRGQAAEGQLPPLQEYLAAADARLKEAGTGAVGMQSALPLLRGLK